MKEGRREWVKREGKRKRAYVLSEKERGREWVKRERERNRVGEEKKSWDEEKSYENPKR